MGKVPSLSISFLAFVCKFCSSIKIATGEMATTVVGGTVYMGQLPRDLALLVLSDCNDRDDILI